MENKTRQNKTLSASVSPYGTQGALAQPTFLHQAVMGPFKIMYSEVQNKKYIFHPKSTAWLSSGQLTSLYKGK